MDEITHEVVWKECIMFGFNINTGHLQLTNGEWGTASYSVESLTANGWEVRPIHVELENK